MVGSGGRWENGGNGGYMVAGLRGEWWRVVMLMVGLRGGRQHGR